ncbi:MAG TPA: Gfo/Idh/MocA family oxidoreductase, partial [Sedimentisphaerales bacterium]|nr:Gfo/Idh/MocA family oxidoreductase [Sedimentisphaerales bacterium]
MAEEKLKTAVVGLDEGGRKLLAGLSRLGNLFEISAVADADADTAQTAGRMHAAESFDDLRRMFAQKELDLVVSSGPLHNCLEHLQSAMKRGTHILRYPPPARSFDEASALFKLAEESDVVFATARWWRHRQAYAALREYIQANPEEQFYLVEAWCSALEPKGHTWLRDPQLAGGGVVLNLAYPLIDQMMAMFPAPQQVFALCTNQAPDRKQRSLLTEETAVVSMVFGDRMTGKITASRSMW